MIFEQHYLDCLSQASYFIGDESTGRAVVVDRQRVSKGIQVTVSRPSKRFTATPPSEMV